MRPMLRMLRIRCVDAQSFERRYFASSANGFTGILDAKNIRESFAKYTEEKKDGKFHARDRNSIFPTSHLGVSSSIYSPEINSSVLVLLVNVREAEQSNATEPWILFTRRSFALRTHPGEISFPGGKLDKGESAEQAALRESHEEIGLDAARVEILGSLEPVPARKGNVVLANVGVLKDEAHLSDLSPMSNEAPVSELVANLHYTNFRRKVGDKENAYHRFCLPVFFAERFRVVASSRGVAPRVPNGGRYRVWGVTAITLYEVLCILLRRESITLRSYQPSSRH